MTHSIGQCQPGFRKPRILDRHHQLEVKLFQSHDIVRIMYLLLTQVDELNLVKASAAAALHRIKN